MWVKDARHKRETLGWLHVYGVQEQVKLGEKRLPWRRRLLTGRRHKEAFWISICRLATWVCSLCENSSCARYFGTLLHIRLSLFLEGKITKYKKLKIHSSTVCHCAFWTRGVLMHVQGQKTERAHNSKGPWNAEAVLEKLASSAADPSANILIQIKILGFVGSVFVSLCNLFSIYYAREEFWISYLLTREYLLPSPVPGICPLLLMVLRCSRMK